MIGLNGLHIKLVGALLVNLSVGTKVYAERILTLAEDAYPAQQGEAVQRQQLKLKVLRVNPQTLDAAVTTATNEQNLRKRFSLRTRHQYVPTEDDDRMEVDHYRPAKRCCKCNKGGKFAKDCSSKPRINAVHNTKNTTQRTIRKK